MSPDQAAQAAAAFRDFLADTPIVSIVVLPGLCTGLDEHPRVTPLRIDLSELFSPPMWPTVTEDGLAFRASFKRVDRAVKVPWAARVDRAVTVPWAALLWAGVPNQGASAKAVAALPTPDVQAPAARADGAVVVHADFAARAKKAGQ